MRKRKQRKSGSISIERNYQNQVLAWQISTFLDESQDLINMLELANRLSPHREVFVEMLDAAGFDTTAWANEAGDMIERLTLSYNRQRQAQITKELIEIISGAEAI